MFYYGKVVEKAQSMTSWTEKFFAVVKGPGWFPGTPRLGDPMGVPEIPVREKYNPIVAGWVNVYTVLHFVLVFFAFDDLSRYNLVRILNQFVSFKKRDIETRVTLDFSFI